MENAMVMESEGLGAGRFAIERPTMRPPKQNRCYVRQRLSVAAEKAEVAALQQRRERVLHALSGLGTTVSQLSVIVAQPELDCEDLRGMGFAAVKTSVQIEQILDTEESLPGSGVLLVNVGADVRPAHECCENLDLVTSVPPIIVVLVLTDEEYSVQVGEEARQLATKSLYNNGADDVMTLRGKEVITSHRVQEAIVRTEILAEKASEVINREVGGLKTRTAKTLQIAWNRFLWDMPGKVLDSIPLKDESLIESANSNTIGVGDYSFTSQLGAGAYCAVFKATHPKLGTCALKVTNKDSIKGVGQLWMLGSEARIMTGLVPHPNIVRAHGVLHTEANIMLIMECAGDLNLHSFVVQTEKARECPGLPVELTESFIKQEAAAIAHLHASLVCHRDLKPSNWVVNDEGTSVRLCGFGLAVMSCGPQQKISHCCGSLPFCAPEVLKMHLEDHPRAGWGYNAFAADVWSLGANFVELSFGSYGIERLMGWVPKHPADKQQRLHDVEHFPEVWAGAPHPSIAGLHSLVAHMIEMCPKKRWSIAQVVGPEGLNIVESHACPMPVLLHHLKQQVHETPDDAQAQAPTGPSCGTSAEWGGETLPAVPEEDQEIPEDQ